ncbi:glycosyl transferase [Candidatus Formimonas warabiya]|uniref:Glycosyl transferase n=1 Tax=Formimonas warabiya TaxID=1761012 RepID=A0A3G1KSF3_FORW1|nr:glycosyltransferase family 2 protein [Candidatus Formimonas warabiya]ATW25388.1 glycosyl transferase [Candidatus Formimonas warabiya]
MTSPFISYVTFNRLGLTERNLKALFQTAEDFEMHIIDNNSQDGTWEFLQELSDPRIKSKTRFDLNYGPIYAVNFNLMKRRPDQYFITIDADVLIKTPNWISCFMDVFNNFPEVGLLGVQRGTPYPPYYPPVVPQVRNTASYLQLQNAFIDTPLDFVPGCCQCLRPELIREIGYWSEENGYGDAELSPRVAHYTSFKVGFVPAIQIDMTQQLGCELCQAQRWCRAPGTSHCFTIRLSSYKNEAFASSFHWKYLETFRELQDGRRTAYCASQLDPQSMVGHLYHPDWASENFSFYIINANYRV